MLTILGNFSLLLLSLLLSLLLLLLLRIKSLSIASYVK